MIARNFARLVIVAAALMAAGCASRPTSIDAQWASPSIASRGKVQSVLVIAALRDSTQRRMLEDRMVEALAAAGVKAAPSHKMLADSPQVSEAQLREAAAGAGASHILISSISGQTTDIRVTPGLVRAPGWWRGRSRGTIGP